MALFDSIRVGASAATESYQIERSLMFNDNDQTDLRRTPSSSGNRRTMTFSFWVKHNTAGYEPEDGEDHYFYSAVKGSNNPQTYIGWKNNRLYVELVTGGSYSGSVATERRFRDVGGWFHCVVWIDTTQSTSSNRVRFYINGVEETDKTGNNVSLQYPSQNFETAFGADCEQVIGEYYGGGGSHNYDGYIAEFHYVNGSTVAPTEFGEYDSNSPNVWIPKDVSGLTFGTLGFYYEFKNSGALGTDSSGNSNTGSVSGSPDQTTDTCTNNFAIINVNDNFFASATISEGGTKVVTDSSAEAMSTSTFAMTKGKWYMEVDFISGAGAKMCGITPTPSFQTSSHGKSGDVTPHTVSYIQSGKVQEGNGSGGQTDLATYSSYGNGNIIGIYMDLDNMKAYFSKDGSLQSSTGIDLEPLASNGTGHYMFFVGDNNSGSCTIEANFGNGFQSLSSTETDDNGHGAFEHSPNITGDGEAKKFFACCSKNLAEFG